MKFKIGDTVRRNPTWGIWDFEFSEKGKYGYETGIVIKDASEVEVKWRHSNLTCNYISPSSQLIIVIDPNELLKEIL